MSGRSAAAIVSAICSRSSDIDAAAHIDAAEDVRQLRQRRIVPDRDAGNVGAAARQRHDAEARRHRGAEPEQARADEGQLAFAAGLAQRRHGVAREQAFLAVGHQRHRPARIDPRRWRMHPDQRLGPVMPGVERRAGRRHPDREVGVAFAQVAQQHVDVGAVDLEAQIGPPHARAGQPERDAGRGEVAGRADPHRLCRRPRSGDVENLIVDREQPPRVVDDKLAGRGQAHARRALVEQVGAEQALQPLDLGADRRLRDAERLRRLGEAAQIDDGDQRPQQFGRNIGHDTFAPHGCSGSAGTATNWVVQAVIPTCGFPAADPCFKSRNNPMASYIPFLLCEIRAITCRFRHI